MTSKEQTRITLRGVHYAEFASQETSCFSATLCFDGTPVCEVSNDGHGGADRHTRLKGQDFDAMQNALAPVNAFIATLAWFEASPGHPIPHTLETVVADVLEAHLTAKQFDRRIKTKLLYVRSDQPGIWATKVPRTKTIDDVLSYYRRVNPGVTYTALNLLPRETALAIYRREGAQ